MLTKLKWQQSIQVFSAVSPLSTCLLVISRTIVSYALTDGWISSQKPCCAVIFQFLKKDEIALNTLMESLESRTRDLYVTCLWFVSLGGTQCLRCWIHGDGALGTVGRGVGSGKVQNLFTLYSVPTPYFCSKTLNFSSFKNNIYLLKHQVVRILAWIFDKTSNRLTWLSWFRDQEMHLVSGQEIKGAKVLNWHPYEAPRLDIPGQVPLS